MSNILLEIGGKELYLDIDVLSHAVQVEKEHLVNKVEDAAAQVSVAT